MTTYMPPSRARLGKKPPRSAGFQRSSGAGALRLKGALAGLAYAGLFFYIYKDYVSIKWGYTGLTYKDLTIDQDIFVISSIFIVSFLMPVRISRPSSLIIWFLYVFVFVPTTVIAFCLGSSGTNYFIPLTALAVAFIVPCIVSEVPYKILPQRPPAPIFRHAILGIWVIFTIVLIVDFRSIMQFSNITDIYYQRFRAADIGNVGYITYLRTYYANVFTPALIVFGLTPKQRIYLLFGLGGSLITYMIDAQKNYLILPIIIGAVYYSLRNQRQPPTWTYTGAIAALVGLCSLLAERITLAAFFVDLVVTRAMAAPGQTFSQYYEYFSANGYTWWSNIKGPSLFVKPPAAYASDPKWPSLGQIVGEHYYGVASGMNSNASLFTGEGIAAGGPLGLAIIGLILAIYLRTLDLAARGWTTSFVMLVLVPVAMTLTNGHLSTTVLSFGGGFWLFVFIVMRPIQGLGVKKGSNMLSRGHHPATNQEGLELSQLDPPDYPAPSDHQQTTEPHGAGSG